MERKAAREIKRQYVAEEAATNQTTAKQTEAHIKAHEFAMAAHLAQYAMAAVLVAKATTEDVIIARHAAFAEAIGEEGSTGMHD